MTKELMGDYYRKEQTCDNNFGEKSHIFTGNSRDKKTMVGYVKFDFRFARVKKK